VLGDVVAGPTEAPRSIGAAMRFRSRRVLSLSIAAAKQKPDWSPDGTKIAFRFLPHCDYDENRIRVVDADGSGLVDLATRSGVQGFSPSWSLDGTEIAFSGSRGQSDRSEGVYVMNADGSGAGRLTPKSFGEAQYPAWSPDGKRIAFVRGDG
jgi:Tol biopolymer transport system component